jgi:hypothetical protein
VVLELDRRPGRDEAEAIRNAVAGERRAPHVGTLREEVQPS